jgi:hypothetical protein
MELEVVDRQGRTIWKAQIAFAKPESEIEIHAKKPHQQMKIGSRLVK